MGFKPKSFLILKNNRIMPALDFSEQELFGNDFSGQNLNGSTFFKAKLDGVQLVETAYKRDYL